MPPLRKFQVFVSATFDDLVEERERVFFAILRARQIPVGMELFTAADDRGWAVIKRCIDESDYYVVIVAGRYGSIDPTLGLSWTEREYRYAVEKGLKILVFIRDDGSINLDKIDAEPGRLRKQEMLGEFKSTLRGAHLCERWKTGDELARKVGDSLRNTIVDDEDGGTLPLGYHRGSSTADATLPVRPTVPLPRELSVASVVLREGVENEVEGHWTPMATTNNTSVQSACLGFRLGVVNPSSEAETGAEYVTVCVKQPGWAGVVASVSPGVALEQAHGADGVENKLKLELDTTPHLRKDYLFHFGPSFSHGQTGALERDGVRCIVHHYTRQGKRRFALLVRPKALLNVGGPEKTWAG